MYFISDATAQFDRELQYYRLPDQRGLNVFEAPKEADIELEDLYVCIGGTTLQYFRESPSPMGSPLAELQNNLALPTANLNFDVRIGEGLRVHLRTYLSSRHHSEAWVKGGY